jgi:hypothetical protein
MLDDCTISLANCQAGKQVGISLTGRPYHSRCTSHEPSGDFLQGAKVDSHATESRVELYNNHVRLEIDEKDQIHTSKSQIGIRRINANGSKLDKTSFGTP